MSRKKTPTYQISSDFHQWKLCCPSFNALVINQSRILSVAFVCFDEENQILVAGYDLEDFAFPNLTDNKCDDTMQEEVNIDDEICIDQEISQPQTKGTYFTTQHFREAT